MINVSRNLSERDRDLMEKWKEEEIPFAHSVKHRTAAELIKEHK